MATGKSYGREMVRALPEGSDRAILTDAYVSSAQNEYRHVSGAETTSVPVNGVAVIALDGNSGTIYVIQKGKDGTDSPVPGYPLIAGRALSLGVGDLVSVIVFIPTSGDGFAYAAISADRGG